MNEPARETPPAPKVEPGKFPPVQDGYVRGRIRDIRRSESVSVYGHIRTLKFDLRLDDGSSSIPVQMSGTDFSGPLQEGAMADVEDPNPSVRPLVTNRVWYPGNGHNFVALYPGRNKATVFPSSIWLIIIIFIPLTIFAAVVAVLGNL